MINPHRGVKVGYKRYFENSLPVGPMSPITNSVRCWPIRFFWREEYNNQDFNRSVNWLGLKPIPYPIAYRKIDNQPKDVI
jgi:hypothetical protein